MPERPHSPACHRTRLPVTSKASRGMETLTLGLDGIEERKFILVKTLKGTVSQSRHGQGLQVQKLGWRWVLLRQDQVPEGDGQLGLTSYQERGRKEISSALFTALASRPSMDTGNLGSICITLSPAKASPGHSARHSSTVLGGTVPRDSREETLTEPAVRHHSDEVLRGQRLKDRHEERNEVLVLRILGLQEKILMVQNHLAVHVLHQNPESLG